MTENNFADALNTPETKSRLRKATRFAVVALVAAAALAVITKKVSGSGTTEQE